ncbi:MAG TPA: hypothetical protein VKL40_15080 [Candidatus Angelobacter sp.]|nr:hypothetical protein [Candidatus Angelobacter sp.]
MPASYVIDKKSRLVMGTATGVLTLDEVLASRRQLMRDPDFDPTFSQLGDLSTVSSIDLTADEVRMLAETSPFSLASRRAFVGERPEVYGLARMYSILRGLRGDQEIRVFRSREAALEWLLEKHKAA